MTTADQHSNEDTSRYKRAHHYSKLRVDICTSDRWLVSAGTDRRADGHWNLSTFPVLRNLVIAQGALDAIVASGLPASVGLALIRGSVHSA